MKVINLNLVYFISKGTVSFCLSKDYGEKEIKEIKKHERISRLRDNREIASSEKIIWEEF